MIVQIACGCPSFESRRKNRINQFFCGCLAICSAYADNGSFEPVTVIFGKLLQHLQTISAKEKNTSAFRFARTPFCFTDTPFCFKVFFKYLHTI